MTTKHKHRMAELYSLAEHIESICKSVDVTSDPVTLRCVFDTIQIKARDIKQLAGKDK